MAIKRAAVSTTGGLLVLSHLLPPNEGVGGLMPTPMKDSAASVKIVSGMPKAIETTIEVSGARQDVAGHHPQHRGRGARPAEWVTEMAAPPRRPDSPAALRSAVPRGK